MPIEIEFSGPGSTFNLKVHSLFGQPKRYLGMDMPNVPVIPSIKIDVFFKEDFGYVTEFTEGIHSIQYNHYIDGQWGTNTDRPDRVSDYANVTEPVVFQPEYNHAEGLMPIGFNRGAKFWWDYEFPLGPFGEYQTPVFGTWMDGGFASPEIIPLTPVNPLPPNGNNTLLDSPWATKGAGQPVIEEGWGPGGLANQVLGPDYREPALLQRGGEKVGIPKRYYMVDGKPVWLNQPSVMEREECAAEPWSWRSACPPGTAPSVSPGTWWSQELNAQCPWLGLGLGRVCPWVTAIEADECSSGDERASLGDYSRSFTKFFVAEPEGKNELFNGYNACACECSEERAAGIVLPSGLPMLGEKCPRNADGECLGWDEAELLWTTARGRMVVDESGNCLKWEWVENPIPKRVIVARPRQHWSRECGHGPDPEDSSITHSYPLDAAGNADPTYNKIMPEYQEKAIVTVVKLEDPIFISANPFVVSMALSMGCGDDVIGLRFVDGIPMDIDPVTGINTGGCGTDISDPSQGCITWCLLASYMDTNTEARSRSSAGGAGGGMDKECVTICKDGEETTGYILFEPSDCLAGGAGAGTGAGGGGVGGGGAGGGGGGGGGGTPTYCGGCEKFDDYNYACYCPDKIFSGEATQLSGYPSGYISSWTSEADCLANCLAAGGGGSVSYAPSLSKCTECDDWEEKGYSTKENCLEDYCNMGTNPNCCN